MCCEKNQRNKNINFKSKNHSAQALMGLFGATGVASGALLAKISGVGFTPECFILTSAMTTLAGAKGYSIGKNLDEKIDVFEREASKRIAEHRKK